MRDCDWLRRSQRSYLCILSNNAPDVTRHQHARFCRRLDVEAKKLQFSDWLPDTGSMAVRVPRAHVHIPNLRVMIAWHALNIARYHDSVCMIRVGRESNICPGLDSGGEKD